VSSIETLEKLYEKSYETVKWDGEKFVPKPLSLSKINLTKLKDSRTFQDNSVPIIYSKAILSVAINIPQQDDERTTGC